MKKLLTYKPFKQKLREADIAEKDFVTHVK